MRHGLRGPVVRRRLGLRGGRARDRRRRSRMIQSGDADAVVTGGSEAALDAARRAAAFARAATRCRDRHLAPVRRPPRRLRDGRGRRRARARGRREGARRAAPTILGDVRGYGATVGRLPPHRARGRGRGAARGDRAWRCDDAGVDARGRRLRQRPRHLDAAQRPRRDDGASRRRSATRAQDDPGLLDQVGDRAPARRRRRRRGGRDHPRAARRDGAADARAARSPTRASTSTTCPDEARPLDVERRAGRSRSRTRSGSAATTPCSAWRRA